MPTTATTHDATMLDELLDADPVPVAEVIADTHYGSADQRQTSLTKVSNSWLPPRRVGSRKGLFSKDQFRIDLEAASTVSCPAGQTLQIPHPPGRETYPSPLCWLAPNVSAARQLHHPGQRPRDRDQPARGTPRSARAQRWTPEFRDRYRHRARAERKIAQIKSRTDKDPLARAHPSTSMGATPRRSAQPRPHRTTRAHLTGRSSPTINVRTGSHPLTVSTKTHGHT